MRVTHTRTKEVGVVEAVSGPPITRVCTVRFDHGTEDVPKALLAPTESIRPTREVEGPARLFPTRLAQTRALPPHRRLQKRPALGLSNSRIDPKLHQVGGTARAREASAPTGSSRTRSGSERRSRPASSSRSCERGWEPTLNEF